MKAAQAIGIDAFALNCASIDKYTPTQLALAYQAAQQVNFKVFISFDFAYWSNGDTGKITAYMQQYANHPAQMQYRGGAVVSTFVGDSFNWSPVKQATSHPIHAVPNLQDPAAASSNSQRGADGAFSWYAWPTDGGNSIIKGPMTTIWDDRYIKDLAGTTYMARELLLNRIHCAMLRSDSGFTMVCYALQQQELGVHMREPAHPALGADAESQAKLGRNHFLER